MDLTFKEKIVLFWSLIAALVLCTILFLFRADLNRPEATETSAESPKAAETLNEDERFKVTQHPTTSHTNFKYQILTITDTQSGCEFINFGHGLVLNPKSCPRSGL